VQGQLKTFIISSKKRGWVKFRLCSQVSLVRQFRRWVHTEIHLLPALTDARLIARLGLLYAKETTPVVDRHTSLVFVVLVPLDIAKIRKSIVSPGSIEMVDVVFWPGPRHVKPCQAVIEVQTISDSDLDISAAVERPGEFPS
jgi:hypothetical protein